MAREDGPRRIVVLATLDTKGDEAAFLADCIRKRGHEPWVVDVGIAGTPPFSGQSPRETVFRAAGQSPESIATMTRQEATTAAADGARRLVLDMIERREVHGIVGIGGGNGTWLGTSVMRALPLGFPKVMVSTGAGGHAGRQVGHTDITMMPSITDVAGVNRILGPILANAACAVSGMAEGVDYELDTDRPAIALTMFGVTTKGATFVRRFLEEAGCEVIAFHANGLGGQTMEHLIEQGAFAGVLDWTTSELTDELVGGRATAGPKRLEAAGAHALPQVIVPGAIDVVNMGSPDGVPEKFKGRTFQMHTPSSILMRMNESESAALGEWMAKKLNAARGPVRVLVPEKGYSALDTPGGVFENRAANDAWLAALRRDLRPDIPVEVVPHHINDEAFARAAAEAMLALCPLPARRS